MATQEYRQKFLIVDDDTALRTVLNIALEAKGNVEVVEAADGAEALKLIDVETFCVFSGLCGSQFSPFSFHRFLGCSTEGGNIPFCSFL